MKKNEVPAMMTMAIVLMILSVVFDDMAGILQTLFIGCILYARIAIMHNDITNKLEK